jgi:AraC-like DNA-binding protein
LADYVDSRLDARIDLDELVSVSGYSRSNFLAMFANTFDATPAQYIIKRRLARARRLLATTDKEIASVAAESGFFDASHLIRHFKREYQITPRAYRHELRASSKKYTFHSAPE